MPPTTDGSGGSGTINFQGVRRNFNIAIVGAGGTGMQTSEGTGTVYNLTSLADFPALIPERAAV